MSVSFVSAQNPLINTYMFDILLSLLKTPPPKNISVTLSPLKLTGTMKCLSVRLCFNNTSMRKCSKVAGKHRMFVFSASF
jgi:hypothetical protein